VGRPADERSSCQPILSTMRLWKGWGTRHSPGCCDEWARLLLAGAKEAAGRTRKNMTPRTSHGSEKENRARAKSIAAANRGWMSEKVLPPVDQEKCFYLTSPFIEPVSQRIHSAPTGRTTLLGGHSPDCAALHPGLFSFSPSGRKGSELRFIVSHPFAKCAKGWAPG
jgi:hypothetical protein